MKAQEREQLRLFRRFRRDGASPKQSRAGRRGFVFSVRVTDDERIELEHRREEDSGPRSLGPWLIWRALHPDVGVLPRQVDGARVGTTAPASDAASSGTTKAARRGPGSTRARAADLAGDGSTDSRAPAIAQVVPLRSRRILDLCGGSGAWSRPYVEAGYAVDVVSLPEQDVRDYVPPSDVWGVLAAPPCDQFSLARNGHPELERDFAGGLEPVVACLRIVALARPRWWALENPTGLLSRWLGTPRDVWQPCDFGDAWTKRTALWGDFTLPTRGPFVAPVDGGGPLCVECRDGRSVCSRADHRAVTPSGFARAFFEANP